MTTDRIVAQDRMPGLAQIKPANNHQPAKDHHRQPEPDIDQGRTDQRGNRQKRHTGQNRITLIQNQKFHSDPIPFNDAGNF